MDRFQIKIEINILLILPIRKSWHHWQSLAVDTSLTVTSWKEQISKALKKWKLNLSDIEYIVSGGAEGVDSMAEDFAIENEIPFKEFEPQWDYYGKAAGPISNRAIMECVTHVLALPSRIYSPGTKSAIKMARKYKREVIVVYV